MPILGHISELFLFSRIGHSALTLLSRKHLPRAHADLEKIVLKVPIVPGGVLVEVLFRVRFVCTGERGARPSAASAVRNVDLDMFMTRPGGNESAAATNGEPGMSLKSK